MINTRTVQLADGSIEVVRILDDHLLKGWQPNNPLAFEKSILWLSPIESLDFVRVGHVRRAQSRRGPLVCSHSDVVLLGYSKLTCDAPVDPATKAYRRRLFYLRENDFLLNMNEFPDGAIDPQTILPGASGSPPNLQEIERGYPWWRCRGATAAQPTAAVLAAAAKPAAV